MTGDKTVTKVTGECTHVATGGETRVMEGVHIFTNQYSIFESMDTWTRKQPHCRPTTPNTHTYGWMNFGQ